MRTHLRAVFEDVERIRQRSPELFAVGRRLGAGAAQRRRLGVRRVVSARAHLPPPVHTGHHAVHTVRPVHGPRRVCTAQMAARSERLRSATSGVLNG